MRNTDVIFLLSSSFSYMLDHSLDDVEQEHHSLNTVLDSSCNGGKQQNVVNGARPWFHLNFMSLIQSITGERKQSKKKSTKKV